MPDKYIYILHLVNRGNMNRILLSFLLIFIFNTLKAQINAITETGRQVVLYHDGTWKYNSDSTGTAKAKDTIKTNPGRFVKTREASFLVKSTRLNIGVFIDPDLWTFTGHKENESNPEFRFTAKSTNSFAMLMTEKSAISLDFMPNIALINAQKASLDAKITSKEYRIVNGHKILCLEMSATVQGIKLRYFGYYFTSSKGTVQFLAFATEDMYASEKIAMEKFLNGFVEINYPGL